MFKCNSITDTLHFDIVNVQWQRNDYDCVVFAIAYATELAHGGDPALYNWDCTSMRSHLVNCLEQRKLDSFPKSEKRKIYCICRMPNDKKRGMVRARSGIILTASQVAKSMWNIVGCVGNVKTG